MLKKENYLDRYSEEKPFTILLAGENLNDGIGDFVHLYDFYKYLKEKYKNEKRIRIQCISFIDDEKLKIINRVYRTELKITESRLESTNDIFLFRTNSESESKTVLLELLDKNVNNDLLFLVPVHRGKLEDIQSRSHIFLAEYERGNFDAPEPCNKINDGIWTFQQNMGVAPDRAGIKIIQPIIEARKVFEEKKDQIPDYENKYFRLAKTEDTFLAAGYMQSEFQADTFIMNSMALAGNKSTINIITNFEKFNSGNNELFYGEKLNNYIKSFNLSRIEVVSSNGEILFEKNVENANSKKTLRIIQFKNISERDKELLFARADCVGASGDTSCSELISSMAFPCIVKKYEFINQLKNQSEQLGLSTLQNYFELLIKVASLERSSFISDCVTDKNYGVMENTLFDYNKIPGFISENHETIESQWRILCAWIIENRNVFDFTDCLIAGALKHSADQLKPGDIDEMYKSLKSDTKNPSLLSRFNFLNEENKQPNISNQEEDDKQHKQSIVNRPGSSQDQH